MFCGFVSEYTDATGLLCWVRYYLHGLGLLAQSDVKDTERFAYDGPAPLGEICQASPSGAANELM